MSAAEYARASSPKLLKEYADFVAEWEIEYKNSPEYKNAIQTQEEVKALKDELNYSSSAIVSENKGFSVVKDIQNMVRNFYKDVNAASVKYPDTTLEALCSRAIDGDQNAKIAVPELKLPLLFGRASAKGDYNRTIAFVNAFNEKLNQISQDETLKKV